MVSSFFRFSLLLSFFTSAFLISSPAHQNYAIAADLPAAVDARVDAVVSLLKEGRDINHLLAAGSGFAAILAALVSDNKAVSLFALALCVGNIIQAMRKQHRIEIAESIKQLVRGSIYVRPY
jgi:ABC-type uncharacterized transport system permease subunit